jgi:hypothetical protein
MDLLQEAGAFLWARIELVLLVATWAGILLAGIRKRRDWKRKRFTRQVNFSLNYVEDGTLRLRTLLEVPTERVWLNDHGVRQVSRAAEKTTVEQPFLMLRAPKDMEFVKRAVLNVLSERFSEAFVARAGGADVLVSRFLFGVTWERYGGIRTQKLRVIIVGRDQLEALCAPGGRDANPRVESEVHHDRVATLRRMWDLTRSRKERERRVVGEVELGVPMPAVTPREPVSYLERRSEPAPASAPADLVPLAPAEERVEPVAPIEIEPADDGPEPAGSLPAAPQKAAAERS